MMIVNENSFILLGISIGFISTNSGVLSSQENFILTATSFLAEVVVMENVIVYEN